jgi:hypothetical protein
MRRSVHAFAFDPAGGFPLPSVTPAADASCVAVQWPVGDVQHSLRLTPAHARALAVQLARAANSVDGWAQLNAEMGAAMADFVAELAKGGTQ